MTAPWENPEFGSGFRPDLRWLPLSDESEQPEVEEAGLPRVVLRYQSRPDEGEEEGELGGPRLWNAIGAPDGFQFSSTTDVDWSDLAIRGPSVVPLLYQIIGNIQANRDSGLNLRVGEPFRKVLAANEQNREGLVFGPGRAIQDAHTGNHWSRDRFAVSVPTGPGYIGSALRAARRPFICTTGSTESDLFKRRWRFADRCATDQVGRRRQFKAKVQEAQWVPNIGW